MRKLFKIIVFLMILSSGNCQKNIFFSKFKTIELPFAMNFATFDIYACENIVNLKEIDVQKYLFSENDNFLTTKLKQNLNKNAYFDYIPVGKIFNKNYRIILYYRNYKTISDDMYIELMLCLFDSKLNLLQTLSLSKFDTQLGIYSLCKINEDCEINIYYLTKEAVIAENMNIGIKKECKYIIMKDKKGKYSFQEMDIEL